jgi:hypothetical protein
MGQKQLLFASIILILSLSNVLADTRYQDAGCLFCPPRRKMITTTLSHVSKSYTPWREEGRYNNLGNNSRAIYSYAIPARTIRTSKFAADIDYNIISKEITDKLKGKSPKYDITETLRGKKTIPPKKVGVAMYRERKETATFKHLVQFQEKVSGKWVNKGPAKTKYTYVTTAYPDITIEIRNR